MKKLILGGVLLSVASMASAQLYLGGSLGQARIDVDCSLVKSCDKSDVGAKLYGGYKLNPLVALEAGWIDFGKVKASEPGYSASQKSSAFTLAAAFRGQLTRQLSVVGRAGVAVVDSKFKERSVYGPSYVEYYSDSESATKPYLGLGVEFAVYKGLKLTASADFSRWKIDDESGSLRMISVGAQYDF